MRAVFYRPLIVELALSTPNFLTCSLWAVNTVIVEERRSLQRSSTRPTRSKFGMGASMRRVDHRCDGSNAQEAVSLAIEIEITQPGSTLAAVRIVGPLGHPRTHRSAAGQLIVRHRPETKARQCRVGLLALPIRRQAEAQRSSRFGVPHHCYPGSRLGRFLDSSRARAGGY